jgi:hypothetical protein
MFPYLESISLALSDLVLGDAAVEHVPGELVWILPVIDQTTRAAISQNYTTVEQIWGGRRVKEMKSRCSLDDLHGHLDVASLGELLHRIELCHESIPEPTPTHATSTQTLRIPPPQTDWDEAETNWAVFPGLTGVGGGGAGRQS